MRPIHLKQITFSTAVGCFLTLCGCGSMGLVDVRDYDSAKETSQTLPSFLGLSPDQVQVGPESRFSTAVVSGVSSDADRQRIANAVQAYNAQHPTLDPVKLYFK